MTEQPTTPDPVEHRRGLLEAWNRRDFDAVQSFFAPDAVWETVGLGTTFEGVAAIRGFWQAWWARCDELWVEPEEVGVVQQNARPTGSAGYVRQRAGWVWVWVEGLIVLAEIDQARAAAERIAEERG